MVPLVPLDPLLYLVPLWGLNNSSISANHLVQGMEEYNSDIICYHCRGLHFKVANFIGLVNF